MAVPTCVLVHYKVMIIEVKWKDLGDTNDFAVLIHTLMQNMLCFFKLYSKFVMKYHLLSSSNKVIITLSVCSCGDC